MKQLCLLCFILFLAACSSSEVPQEALDIIETVKQEFAPDKRVARFDIQAEMQENGKILLQGESNLPDAVAQLTQKMEAAGLPFGKQITMLPAKELEGQIHGVVRLSVANIRSEPKHSGELATQAMLGTPLNVLKQQEDWYYVQTPDGYLSWLDKGGFQLMDEKTFLNWQKKEKAVFLPDFGFAYQHPDEQSTVVSDLLAGNIIAKYREENGFTQVEFPDGRIAYVPSSQLMAYDSWLASRQPDATQILDDARRFLGRPYLWGGTSGKGVDCSGFTKTVFFLNGIQLPRDASQQVHTGIAVETDTSLVNLQAGDLLFFGRKATPEQKEKITHVAIYMGDGQIIHSSGNVKIESLRPQDPNFAEERLQTFVRAKRPLASVGENGIIPLQSLELYQ